MKSKSKCREDTKADKEIGKCKEEIKGKGKKNKISKMLNYVGEKEETSSGEELKVGDKRIEDKDETKDIKVQEEILEMM